MGEWGMRDGEWGVRGSRRILWARSVLNLLANSVLQTLRMCRIYLAESLSGMAHKTVVASVQKG